MKEKHSRMLAVIVAVLVAAALTPVVLSHCQIPCGIYDDNARLARLSEDITTVEKSIKQITALSAASEKNHNQIVRWVMNKETHCDHIIDVVTDYFMAQRLEPVKKTELAYMKYVDQLTYLHGMIVHAMKAKQTTDLDNVETMRRLLKEFGELYQDH